MRLYITRHGETDANVEGILQGWIDTELNVKGIAQASEAANSFNKRVDAIFSSDLKRATRTAQEFRNRYKDVPYFEDGRLRVRGFGDAAGTHREGHDLEQFWAVEDRSTIPNAETVNDLTARIANFLEELKAKPYKSVLVVTHGNVINRMQMILDPNHESRPQENVTILEIDI